MQTGQGEIPNIDGRRFRVGIVVARFNADITSRTLQGAFLALKQSGVEKANIVQEWVPGSAEVPFMLAEFAKNGTFDALVALSCVLKGETDHYYYVSQLVTQGVLDVSLRYHIPIGFGVLTVETKEQALDRSGEGERNIGFQAAMAALEGASKRLY